MANPFEVPYGAMTSDYQERVVKNAMVIDVLGHVTVFADLHPVNMAAIQSNLYQYDVLLAISETGQQTAKKEGNKVELSFSALKIATAEQTDTLAALALRDMNDDQPIPRKLIDTSRRILPALWYSDIAFTRDGLLQ